MLILAGCVLMRDISRLLALLLVSISLAVAVVLGNFEPAAVAL